MASVVFSEPAEYDLLDIEYYIFVDLCNPQAARMYIIRVLYNKVDWQNLFKR